MKCIFIVKYKKFRIFFQKHLHFYSESCIIKAQQENTPETKGVFDMNNKEIKKALLLLDKSDTEKSLSMAEALWEQGYDLYAKGDMVLFFNMNMVPVSTCPADGSVSFDCVVQ